MRHFLATVLALGCLAAPAAASTWTPPITLSSTDGSLPALDVGREGDAVVGWTHDGGVWVSTRAAGDVFRAPERLGAGAWPSVAIDDAGEAIVAWMGTDGGMYVTQQSRRGTFGPPRLVSAEQRSGYTEPLRSAVAINARGDAAVTWFEPPVDWAPSGSSSSVRRTMAAVRSAGGVFQPPQEIARSDSTADFPAVFLDDAGRATVAWRAGGTWVASGDVARGFGPAEAAGGDPAVETSGFSLAGSPSGDVTLAVTAGPFVHQSSSLPQGVYVASRPAGGNFGPFRSIAAAAGPPLFGAFGPHLAMRDGAAAIAWGGGAGEVFNVKPARGDWLPPQPFSVSSGSPESPRDAAVGIDAHGTTVFALALERGLSARRPITVVRRLANGQIEPPVALGAPGTRNISPTVGFDGAGNGVLVWEAGDADPGDSSGYDTKQPIKLALYDGSAPSIANFALARKRTRFRMRVSEPVRAEVTIRRAGRTVGRVRARLKLGTRTLRIPRRVRRKLHSAGRYVATATARDSANRRSRARRIRF
jgi:hypothetical protein